MVTKTIRRDRDSFGGGLILYTNQHIPSKDLTLGLFPWVLNQLCLILWKTGNASVLDFINPLLKMRNTFLIIYQRQVSWLANMTKLFWLEINWLLKTTVSKTSWTLFDKNTNLSPVFEPRCIDLILTNKKELFKNSDVSKVRISDYHSFIVAALKSQLLKGNAKTKFYRDYNSFRSIFKGDLENSFKNNFITEYSDFQNVFLEVFHKHAPIKKRY